MKVDRFASVWDAIEENQADRSALKLRSQLMLKLRDYIAGSELSQVEIAKLLGISQPQVLELLRGKINSFSAEILLDMLTKAGLLATEDDRSAVDSVQPDVS